MSAEVQINTNKWSFEFIELIGPFKNIYQFIAVNLGLGTLITIAFSNPSSQTLKGFLISTVWGAAIGITQWLGHAYTNGVLNNFFPWRTQLTKRVVSGLVILVVEAALMYGLVQSALYLVFFGKLPSGFMSLDFWIIPIVIAFIINLIVITIAFFKAWQRELIAGERAKTEAIKYKYATLKSQINPHFMFNSLNVLKALMNKDQAAANQFIDRFSEVYRYVLRIEKEELVPLKEELEFSKDYMALLSYRFGDKLTYAIEQRGNTNAYIVPMTLQLLIENAVKHNSISKETPLHISVDVAEGHMVVKNNKQLKSSSPESFQLGLKNLKQQYAYLGNSQVEITEEDAYFAVNIPLIQLDT